VQHATRDIGCDNAAKAMSTEAAAAAAAKDVLTDTFIFFINSS